MSSSSLPSQAEPTGGWKKFPPSEEKEYVVQMKIVHFLRSKGLLFSSTTGGIAYKPHQKINMYKRGYAAGVPDLIIFEPRGLFHGLCLEVKRKGGRVRDSQKDFIAALRENGYAVAVVFSPEEAQEVVENYISIPFSEKIDFP